jgi:hypothetical protein
MKNMMPPPIRSALKRCTSRSRGIQNTSRGFENRETKHLGGEKKRKLKSQEERREGGK